ncbi:MAG: creatininase family protein [Tropicimonas sp.]|uniref:creatininase family protein n=1 Tax=Tropicimonas sp. TaxID=2067044 RepID=UPI003A89B822
MTRPAGEEFRLARMTSPEIAQAAQAGGRPLAVMPVGAIEQHGPHLSVGVDIRLATAVAEAAVERTPGCYLAAPLPYGVSPHHRDFAGTMSLGAPTFVAILSELGGNLWEDGFLPVFLNGHGGNRPALGVAVSTLGAGGVTSAAITYFEHIADTAADVLPDAAGGTGHAGALETSLMMYVARAEVRPDAIPPGRTPDGWPDPHLYAGPAPTIWRPFSGINPTGVVGTPSDASEGAGKTLFEVATDRTSDLLSRIKHNYG